MRMLEAIPGPMFQNLPTEEIALFIKRLGSLSHILPLILALLGCFCGFRFCRFFISLSGFILGLIIGYGIGAGPLQLKIPLVLLAALAGGVILAIFAYRIYQVGIFIFAYLMAFILAASFLPLRGSLQFLICTVAGLAVGALALRYIKAVIIIASSLAGGIYAGELLTTLGRELSLPYLRTMAPVMLSLILILLGIGIQFLTTRHSY